jgi:shikimate kinase
LASLPVSEQVYLVGFMGAGKTTCGAELAALLGWRFVDLDEAICLRYGKSIPEIFREGGEPSFRRLEREILISLTSLPKVVVATGGGTYVAGENRNLVEAAGWSVWLQVGLSEALRRCGGGIGRPMWGSRAEIEALYRYRLEFYRCARIQVETEGIPPARVAGRVLECLLEKGFVRS